MLTIALLLMLLMSRRYRLLRLTQVYLFIPIVLSILYNNYTIFYNWTFYYFKIAIEAILYLFCFWEIFKFTSGRSLNQVWMFFVAIILLPLTPFAIVAKITLSFSIANFFVILQTKKIVEDRSPLLILFLIVNSLSITIDAFKLFITLEQILTVMRTIEVMSVIILKTGMIIIFAWEPIKNNVYRFLLWLRKITRPKTMTATNVTGSQPNKTIKLDMNNVMLQGVDIAISDVDIEVPESETRIVSQGNAAINSGLKEIHSFITFMCFVADDAMHPTLEAGDAIFTSDQTISCNDIENGSIYGIKLTHEEIIFRIVFYNRDSSTISLLPVNKEYKRQHLKQDDIQAVYQILSVKKPDFNDITA